MDDFQPFFRAFLLHTGSEPEQAKNTDYIIWISRKWNEWRQKVGLDGRAVIDLEMQERFGKWLFETVPEGQLEMQF